MDRLGMLTLTDFFDRLGSKEPVPGGGAAAGITGALSASLAAMVVAYSLGRKSLADHQDELTELNTMLIALRDGFLKLADLDAEAYASLSGLWGLPADDPRRVQEWEAALSQAIEVPTGIMIAGEALLEAFQQLASVCNKNLHSDLAGAASLAEACIKAAGQNVRVNAAMLDDEARKQNLLDDLAARRAEATAMCAVIEKACGS